VKNLFRLFLCYLVLFALSADMAKAYALDTYKLRIDEERTPEWFDDEMKEAVTAKLAEIIKVMIVPKSGMTLLGGDRIVPPRWTGTRL